MKNRKLIIGLSVVLAVLIVIFAGVYFATRQPAETGSKDLSVTVIFADKSEKEYKINTDAEYLADALLEEKIIDEKSADGMYTVIAGERADYNLDGSWWCVTKDGEMTEVGMNEQPISDGDSFEITNTPS